MKEENKIIQYELKTSDGWKLFKRPYSNNLEGSLKYMDTMDRVRNVSILESGILKELDYFPRDDS